MKRIGIAFGMFCALGAAGLVHATHDGYICFDVRNLGIACFNRSGNLIAFIE